jgi:hypothetical protein
MPFVKFARRILKKDNGSKFIKQAMRSKLLEKIDSPRILEAYGGKGELGKALYLQYPGVVFERDSLKTQYLAEQRPNWAVYEGDCVKAMAAGIGFHFRPNFLDFDPYGSPWPAIRAAFAQGDKLDARVGVVVNDGLRRFAMLGRAWKSVDLAEYAKKLGNQGVHKQWVSVVRDIFDRVVWEAGFSVREWAIRSAGVGGQMTHYAAIIERKKAPARAGG